MSFCALIENIWHKLFRLASIVTPLGLFVTLSHHRSISRDSLAFSVHRFLSLCPEECRLQNALFFVFFFLFPVVDHNLFESFFGFLTMFWSFGCSDKSHFFCFWFFNWVCLFSFLVHTFKFLDIECRLWKVLKFTPCFWDFGVKPRFICFLRCFDTFKKFLSTKICTVELLFLSSKPWFRLAQEMLFQDNDNFQFFIL